AKIPALHPVKYNLGNEIPGNNKKDIYADKSARHPARESVKKQNAAYGKCPQPINITSILKHRRYVVCYLHYGHVLMQGLHQIGNKNYGVASMTRGKSAVSDVL